MNKKMLVIKNIEFIEVDGDMHRLYSMHPSEGVFGRDEIGSRMMPVQEVVENIRGRRFTRFFTDDKGETTVETDVMLAIPEEYQKLLGLSYATFDNMEREIRVKEVQVTNMKSSVKRSKSKLSRILAAPWYTRLMWLFTGVK